MLAVLSRAGVDVAAAHALVQQARQAAESAIEAVQREAAARAEVEAAVPAAGHVLVAKVAPRPRSKVARAAARERREGQRRER